MNKVVTTMLGPLEARERDVLVGRYGLMGTPMATLAEIGNRYGITRERVRQIEALALTTTRKRLSDPQTKAFVQTAIAELKRMGSVSRDDLLMHALAKKLMGNESEAHFASAARFLMELSGKISFRREDLTTYPYWYLTDADEKRAHTLVTKLAATVKAKREEILSNGKGVGHYLAELSKGMKVASAVGEQYVAISKKFMTSPFGTFGLADWPEVNPKTARDWAYLIAKKEEKPLHFTALVARINEHRTHKITNVQTVHNELIKDDRFVLVGRGIYGLREFGLLPGTAKEVLAHFIKRHGPLPSKDLMKLVLQERFFKEGTLLINLQNKEYFKRLSDGRYALKEV